MHTIRIEDLVGRKIAGVRANIVRPVYRDQTPYIQDPETMFATLKLAYWKRENGKRWLRLEWEKRPNYPLDCGFSGWLDGLCFVGTGEDGKPTIEVERIPEA